jgi:hypothetical protein
MAPPPNPPSTIVVAAPGFINAAFTRARRSISAIDDVDCCRAGNAAPLVAGGGRNRDRFKFVGGGAEKGTTEDGEEEEEGPRWWRAAAEGVGVVARDEWALE